MAKNRYSNTPYFTNNYSIYEDVFEDRGVKFIRQYGCTSMKALTDAQKSSIVEKKIFWEYGDRLDKIASREYGDPTYWWVIARYNKKPTDAHFKRGDVVLVPSPISLIVAYYTE
jgi:hypothetical protein